MPSVTSVAIEILSAGFQLLKHPDTDVEIYLPDVELRSFRTITELTTPLSSYHHRGNRVFHYH